MADRQSHARRLGVRFWGVRGSLPTPGADTVAVGGNTPCVEILTPSSRETIIIDAGSGIRALGRELISRSDPPGRIHLFLSHFHWDHLQGLPFFAPLFTAGTVIDCYAACEPHHLKHVLTGQMASPYYPFPLADAASQLNYRSIGEAGVVIGQPPDSVTIAPFPLRHPQGCTGFRVESENAAVVYASDFERGDPGYDAALDRACHGAGLLICDAQYTDEELETHRGWGHSTWRQATEVARGAAVGRLALFHHDPIRTDAEISRIVDEARTLFPSTDAAREGDVIST